MAARKAGPDLASVFGSGGSPPESGADADVDLDDDTEAADLDDVAIIQDAASEPGDVAEAIRRIAGRV